MHFCSELALVRKFGALLRPTFENSLVDGVLYFPFLVVVLKFSLFFEFLCIWAFIGFYFKNLLIFARLSSSHSICQFMMFRHFFALLVLILCVHFLFLLIFHLASFTCCSLNCFIFLIFYSSYFCV